ncbi:D-aminoacyl-tRNA deacylase [Mariniplasma anaerobium]|uniref:D-aminoacyl-tRNA deacylase n=1 Tax=Mariniplasma anaerobium TaxID=2735436 RepID=A0A7U9TJA7_9MOLU|nr:D-aminoacyl-tRNA deacylase [Mariniplasma anaerobium]BCR35976.1 D-aminoacyl-tRNA deacylase [Mariniplasma anaerobium]
MRVIVQRVKQASVEVKHKEVASISKGYLLYIGLSDTDNEKIVEKVATKVKNLRIFEDEHQKMNLSLKQVNGSILAVSQFTLYGDTKGNNRPSFIRAARPEVAKPLYESFIAHLKEEFDVKSGIFQEDMDILSVNDGPVTIIIEID